MVTARSRDWEFQARYFERAIFWQIAVFSEVVFKFSVVRSVEIMPGGNCPVFGCGSGRRTSLSYRYASLSSWKWRKEYPGRVKEARERDQYFRGRIKRDPLTPARSISRLKKWVSSCNQLKFEIIAPHIMISQDPSLGSFTEDYYDNFYTLRFSWLFFELLPHCCFTFLIILSTRRRKIEGQIWRRT